MPLRSSPGHPPDTPDPVNPGSPSLDPPGPSPIPRRGHLSYLDTELLYRGGQRLAHPAGQIEARLRTERGTSGGGGGEIERASGGPPRERSQAF